MHRLLHEFPQPEYPDDYLLSRLKARRASFIHGFGSNHTSGTLHGNEEDRIRELFSIERGWLICQLNRKQRYELAPLFLYFEVEVLVQCLRCIEAGQVQDLENMLQKSLLAGRIKKILLSSSGVADAAVRLAQVFTAARVQVKGLADSYEAGGVQKSEEMVRRALVGHAFKFCSDPDVLDFFRDIVDMRNTLSLAKYIHWQVASPPNLYHGGHFRDRFVQGKVTEDMLLRMIIRWARGAVVNEEMKHPVQLEPYLSRKLLEKMNRQRRVSGPMTSVIEYLWRWHVAARATGSYEKVVQ